MMDPNQCNPKIMGLAHEIKTLDGNECFHLYGQIRIEVRRYARKDLPIVPLGSGTVLYMPFYEISRK